MIQTTLILAGGLATRLHPLSQNCPKALIDVNGTPFIGHQLAYLKTQHIKDVVICLGHLGHMIRTTLGHSYEGMSINYSEDGPTPLGTGGAISKALATKPLHEPVFVMYGDSYLPIDFLAVSDAYESANKPALMTLYRNDDRWDKSNVEFEAGKVIEYNKQAPSDKMKYIDYGLSILTRSTICNITQETAFDVGEVFYHLSKSDQLAGYVATERFYEIGSHQGLAETCDYLAGHQPLTKISNLTL